MNANALREAIAKLEHELKEKQESLVDVERNCAHVWGETFSDHINSPGYISPGDPEGTMGIDRRLPLYVPEKVTKRWKRVCSNCGRVEHTTAVSKQVTETPRFGN
jgi:hypothetical protein